MSQQADAWSSGSLLTNYSYDPNGAVTGMRKVPSSGASSLDSLVYSYRGLTEGFLHREYSGASVTPTSEWCYRYSAGGEREQKRLYLQQDSLHNVIPHNSWVYYLLGGRKEQLAVYHGQEIWLPICLPAAPASVYLYPVEYNYEDQLALSIARGASFLVMIDRCGNVVKMFSGEIQR